MFNSSLMRSTFFTILFFLSNSTPNIIGSQETSSAQNSSTDIIQVVSTAQEALLQVIVYLKDKHPTLFEQFNQAANQLTEKNPNPTSPLENEFRTLQIMKILLTNGITALETQKIAPETFIIPPVETVDASVYYALAQEVHSLAQQLKEKCTTLIPKLKEDVIVAIVGQLDILEQIIQIVYYRLHTQDASGNKAILDRLTQERAVIQQAKFQLANSPQIDTVHIVHIYIEKLYNALKDARAHKFAPDSFPPIALDEIFRSKKQDISVDGLTEEINLIQADINALITHVERDGLNILNKAARFAGSYIVDPIVRNGLPIAAGTALVTTAILAGYHLNVRGGAIGEWLHNKLGTWIFGKPFIGWLPHTYGLYGENPQVVNDKGELLRDYTEASKILGNPAAYKEKYTVRPQGVLYDIEKFLIKLATGQAPLLTYSLSALGGISGYILYQYDPLKYVGAMLNALKGGNFKDMAAKSLGESTKVTFRDVIGMEGAKEDFKNLFAYLQNPDRWHALHHAKIPYTYLFSGKTRAGKTYFARAIKGELEEVLGSKVAFVELSHYRIKRYGIKYLLNSVAMNNKHAVVFIDELHLLGLQGTGDSSLLAEFLTALSGVEQNNPDHHIIFIAATNKPENIADALRQPGRLEKEIRFSYPTYQQRIIYLNNILAKQGIQPDLFGIDVAQLALEAHGCSFETLQQVIDKAVVMTRTEKMAMNHIVVEMAFDEIVRGIEFHGESGLSPSAKRFIAANVAGTCLAANELQSTLKVSKATIRPIKSKVKEKALGYDLWQPVSDSETGMHYGQTFFYIPAEQIDSFTEKDRVDSIKIELAAVIAQRVLFGTVDSLGYEIRNWVVKSLTTIELGGREVNLLPDKAREKIKETVDEKLALMEKELEEILTKNIDKLKLLVSTLINKETLGKIELFMLLNPEQAQQMLEEFNNMQAQTA